MLELLHPDFVPPDYKGDLSAPGVDETRPASVEDDVLSISRTEAYGWVVKRLPCILEDFREK